MTTKYQCMHLKDRQDVDINDSTGVYSNFTLNKSHKCTSTAFDQKGSKILEIGNRKNSNYDMTAVLTKASDFSEKTTPKKDIFSLKKPHKTSSKDYFNTNFNEANGEKIIFSSCNKSSSSTLSLHIAAYESFVETQVTDFLADKELKKKDTITTTSKTLVQQSTVSPSFNDLLEFPRQQENKATTPEIQQFATSQKLFTPIQQPCTSPVVPEAAEIPKAIIMDPACSVCQVAITFHEALQNEEQTNLLQALKNVSNSDSTKHTCNLLDVICKAESPLQFPLCKDCATRICSDLRKRVLDLEEECLKYETAYSDQQKKRKNLPYDAESIRRELQDLTIQEKELLEELTNLESEERRINNDIRELSRQASEVNEEGDTLYRELRSNHRKLIECNDDTSSLKTEIAYMEEEIKNLRAVNVLDMTFCVGIHESYGTINGLRLGRLPHEAIEWNEINAAFGQVALLVQVLGEKVNATFSDYEIDPRGNNSYIRKISGSKTIEYPLFGNGGWKPFGQLNLDHAIVGLIYCIMQVEGKLKELHKNKENILPYRLEGDRIFENEVIYRVKMQFNSEERWTKAMKLLLMNLKRLVALAPHTIVQKV